jgi:hypothetical protein
MENSKDGSASSRIMSVNRMPGRAPAPLKDISFISIGISHRKATVETNIHLYFTIINLYIYPRRLLYCLDQR